ncbi:MAG TPA: tetratricopeptide repeat protein [Drouetiella sp.]
MNSSLGKISIANLMLLLSVAITGGAFAQTGEHYMMDGKPVPRSYFEAGPFLTEGTNLLRANRNQEAAEKLKQAIAIAPDFAEAHHNYALALAKLGDTPDAIDQLNQALRLKPSLETGWLSLGGLYQSSGNVDEAIKIYKSFLTRFPTSKDAPKISSLVQGLQKEFSAETTSTVRTLGMTAPSNPSPKDYLGDVTRQGTMRWPSERLPIKVYMRAGVGVPGFQPKYAEIVQQSFKDWSAASGGELSFKFVPAAAQSDVEVSWTNNPAKLANRAEAGEARLSSNSAGIVHCTIQFCTVPLMPGISITPNRIRMISLHEIGHALGLTGHTTNPDDAMFYSTLLADKWRNLTERDAHTITRLYAPSAATHAESAVPDGT